MVNQTVTSARGPATGIGYPCAAFLPPRGEAIFVPILAYLTLVKGIA